MLRLHIQFSQDPVAAIHVEVKLVIVVLSLVTLVRITVRLNVSSDLQRVRPVGVPGDSRAARKLEIETIHRGGERPGFYITLHKSAWPLVRIRNHLPVNSTSGVASGSAIAGSVPFDVPNAIGHTIIYLTSILASVQLKEVAALRVQAASSKIIQDDLG